MSDVRHDTDALRAIRACITLARREHFMRGERGTDGVIGEWHSWADEADAQLAALVDENAEYVRLFELARKAMEALEARHREAHPEMYEPREDGRVLGYLDTGKLARWAVDRIDTLTERTEAEPAESSQIVGQWPGDETDEEFQAALDEHNP